MFIEILIISLIYSKIRNRKISNLERIDIKKGYLIIIGFLIQIVSSFIVFNFNNKLSIYLEEYYYIIHILIYSLLIIGMLFNYKYKGFKIMTIGMVLNFIPIVFNAGKMPVSENALIKAGLDSQLELLLSGNSPTHILSSEITKFKYLIDLIPISKPYILPKVISIGDIILAIGLFIFISEYTKDRN